MALEAVLWLLHGHTLILHTPKKQNKQKLNLKLERVCKLLSRTRKVDVRNQLPRTALSRKEKAKGWTGGDSYHGGARRWEPLGPAIKESCREPAQACACLGLRAKGSSNSVTDKQGSVIGLILKVLQVRADEPCLVIRRARPGPPSAGSTLYCIVPERAQRNTLAYSLALPCVDLKSTALCFFWLFLLCFPFCGVED